MASLSDASGETPWARYAAFLSAPPEQVLEWSDPESPARGWLVINSLRGGAAGGGTRMRKGLARDEVVFLAKIMELKFSVSGPPIGGAKSGLDFDPADPRKPGVLRRWFGAIRPLLESRYATAGDLNVDEVREVVPLCGEAGISHPQQAVARGHHGLEGPALERRMRAVREALGRRVGGGLGLAGVDLRTVDLVTGHGVAVAARRLLERQRGSLSGSRVLLEGFGNVGGAAALFLARWGARLVGLADAHGALLPDRGLGMPEVEGLLRHRPGTRIPVERLSAAGEAARRAFLGRPADLLVCAAASGTLGADELDRLEAAGVKAIVSGANRPFATASPGDTALERQADARFAVVADFVANCGAAHAFAWQLARDVPGEPAEILDSVAGTVTRALDGAVDRAGRADRGLLAAALATAMERTGTD